MNLKTVALKRCSEILISSKNKLEKTHKVSLTECQIINSEENRNHCFSEVIRYPQKEHRDILDIYESMGKVVYTLFVEPEKLDDEIRNTDVFCTFDWAKKKSFNNETRVINWEQFKSCFEFKLEKLVEIVMNKGVRFIQIDSVIFFARGIVLTKPLDELKKLKVDFGMGLPSTSFEHLVAIRNYLLMFSSEGFKPIFFTQLLALERELTIKNGGIDNQQVISIEQYNQHSLQGVCICGRSSSTLLSPSFGVNHADESGLAHSLEQWNSGQGSSSVVSSLLAVLIPIKLYLDFRSIQVYKEKSFRLKSIDFQENWEPFSKNQKRIIEFESNEFWFQMLAKNPLFYTAAFGNLVGNVQAFWFGLGGVPQALSGISFSLLGTLSSFDGIKEVYNGHVLKTKMSSNQQTTLNKKKEFELQLARYASRKQLNGVVKFVGGSLTLVGYVVPGAQLALGLGVLMVMFPAMKSGFTWIKSKLWAAHDHRSSLVRVQTDNTFWAKDCSYLTDLKKNYAAFKNEFKTKQVASENLRTFWMKKYDLDRNYLENLRSILLNLWGDGLKKQSKGLQDLDLFLFDVTCRLNELGKKKNDLETTSSVLQYLEKNETLLSEMLSINSYGFLKRLIYRRYINFLISQKWISLQGQSNGTQSRYFIPLGKEEEVWRYLESKKSINDTLFHIFDQRIHALEHEIEELLRLESITK